MPELPEVEIVRRNLSTWWQGHSASNVVVHDEALLDGIDPDANQEVMKRTLRRAWRRGKYLVAIFDDDSAVIFHFRMSGKIIRADHPDPAYARLAWHVPASGWLSFVDRRRLGSAEYLPPGALEHYEPFARMGPESLGVTGEQLRQRLSPNRLLKASLLDQSVVAGLGNIAITEIFWRMQLPPRARPREFTEQQYDLLARTTNAFLSDVLTAEEAEEVVYLNEGRHDNPFDAYGREGQPCPRCGSLIARTKVSGRSTYYCPPCQPDP